MDIVKELNHSGIFVMMDYGSLWRMFIEIIRFFLFVLDLELKGMWLKCSEIKLKISGIILEL